MAGRMEVLWRLWALVWVNTAGYILLVLALILGSIIGSVDLLWQLVTGGEGVSDGNRGFQFVNATLSWSTGQFSYALTGSSSFQWLPAY